MSDSDIINCMFNPIVCQNPKGVDFEVFYYSRWSPHKSSIHLRLPPNSTASTIKRAIEIYMNIQWDLANLYPIKLEFAKGFRTVPDCTPLSELLDEKLMFSPAVSPAIAADMVLDE